MRQFKYAFYDIKFMKADSIIFLIQFAVVFLLVSSSVSSYFIIMDGIKRLNIMESNNAYINQDSTESVKIDRLFENDLQSCEKGKELFSYIKQSRSDYFTYSVWGYVSNQKINNIYLTQYNADDNFFDMLGLYVSDGNDYKTYNTKSNDITPIIIGYGMSSEYDIGQLCNFPDLNSGQEKQYCVVGILPMNSSMPSLVDIGESVSLDYSYFQPIVEGSLDSLGSIDMAISSTVVFTEDESILRAIEEKSAQLDLFDMNYIHITDSIEEYIKLFKQTVEMKMFMCIVISLFSLISMIVSIMTMLSKKEYEFAIHYILGGTHLDIASRIVFRVMLLTFIASIPSIICFWGSKALIVLFMLLLIIIISITILPLFRIRNMNIIQILANTRR